MKTTAALVAAAIALLALGCAQDTMTKPDPMAKESMKKDEMKKDGMDTMKK